jgi:hypothetical protein
MQKKVGIVMVSYKDYVNRFLIECRDSLRAQDYPKDLYVVYIIDNCTINDCEYAKANYPEAVAIGTDHGNYAAANNIGIKKAIEDGCEYLIVANMDTKFKSDWISELVKAFESEPNIGIAQSKMLLYPQNEEEWKRPRINSLGNIIHYLGFGFTDAYNELDREISGYPEIKGYSSGCSFITSKEVLQKIGLYDEEYYMYHDDVEMGWRLKLAGYKIILAPKSVMYHKYEFKRSIMMLYYIERNRYLAIFHYYKFATIILLLPAIVAMELGMIFYSIVNGWFSKEIQIIKYFLLPETWSKILAKRKQVQKLRVKKDKDVVKNFVGRVLFQEVDNPVLKYIANPIFNLYWQIAKRIIFW